MFQNILQSNDQEVEFMPIVPLGEDELNDEEKSKLPTDIPLIALRNTVLFPNVVLPITVSREKSIKALDYANSNAKWIGVLAQKDIQNEDPSVDEIYKVGTLAKIIKQIKMPDGNITLFIMGKMRFSVEEITQSDPFLKAKIKLLDDVYPKDDTKFIALSSSIKDYAEKILMQSSNVPNEAGIVLRNIEQHSFLINFIISNINAKLEEKQSLLETNDVRDRAERLLQILQIELQMVELKNEITNKTRGELDKQQREYFLQQQLKSIKDELGGDPNERELKDLQKRAEGMNWSNAAKDLFEKNIQKLERMHSSTPDYSVIYNHLDLMLDLPWNQYTDDSYDLNKAEKILNNEHYGMDKIKDRILEYLAVLKLKGDMKSPILCFVGPPGIGKTSLGKSIANAVNRKYVRLSLGGMHDESEIRGHRKTYIGAMPGRIIQSLRKVKSANPVFILDEIDKIGQDHRGDPSSALLEVLDPEQNSTFYDNYLELEFDLSKVLFVATANSLQDIQPALRDRLEIIYLNGYSIEEKTEIAKKHLIPKQKEMHGINKIPLRWNDKVIQQVIQDYTRESGVRELDRYIASIMRNIAKDIALDKKVETQLNAEKIEKILGKAKYSNDIYKRALNEGVAVGLAWTSVGGEILFIETSKSKGKSGGSLTITGNLGNIMKESATIALTYLKSNALSLGIDENLFDEYNFHLHVPEGAVPKDGPSAGITILSAFASLLKGKKVKRYLAMTGEITLRGEVLPVGGIKEKILAAKRAGLKEIMLCTRNQKDIEEINPSFIKGISFYYVNDMRDVLNYAVK